MIKIVKFAKPSHRDSFGRNRFVQTTGVEIYDASIRDVDPDRDNSVMLSPINSRGQVSEACRLSISRSAIPEVIAALREVQGTMHRDFDDVSNTDRYYLRRIYDLIGQASLERLVEAIKGYEFEDQAVKTGFFNLEAEIYRRAPGEPQTGYCGTDPSTLARDVEAVLQAAQEGDVAAQRVETRIRQAAAARQQMAKVFYSDGSGNARPRDPSIVPGWYYQIDMATPVGPFDSKADAIRAAQETR